MHAERPPRPSAKGVFSNTSASASFQSVSISLIYAAKAHASGDCNVVRVDGTVTKICQIIGDFDLERNQSTISLTYTRYSVAGTDLDRSHKSSFCQVQATAKTRANKKNRCHHISFAGQQ
jgi:hypothetical protein